MTQPLFYQNGGVQAGQLLASANLRQFSDSDFERLRYNTRVAFANAAQLGQPGAIFQGNGGTRIGSSINTFRTARTNTGAGPGFPGAPGTVTSSTTFNYGQNRTTPGDPTNFANSYLYLAAADQATGADLRLQGDLAIIRNDIITPALAELRTGDEVGSYRISVNSPGAGWTNLGTWFNDTRFNGNTDYRLWIRTTASVPADRRPVGFNNGIVELNTGPNGALIQQICLPLLQQVAPDYTVRNDTQGNRGVWTDTRLSGTTTTNSAPPPGTNPGPADIYSTTSTPSGNALTINTYSLEMN